MDVREQLETLTAQPAPDRDVGLQLFRRGRRRLRRRRTLATGGVAAALVVSVLAWPGGMPGSGRVIIDDVVGATDDSAGPDDGTEPGPEDGTAPDRRTEPDEGHDDVTAGSRGPLTAPVQVAIGDVELTVPVGVQLQSQDAPVTTPCHPGTTAPTVHVLAAGIDSELPDCEGETSTATSIVAAPASRMPPAYLPGEGTPDSELDVTQVELLGTTGTSETYEQQDGTEVTSYVFGKLDLYLAVRGPELTPALVDELLASAEWRSAADSSSEA